MKTLGRALAVFAFAVSGSPAGLVAEECRLSRSTAADRAVGMPFEELAVQAASAVDAGRLEDAARLYRGGLELNPMWVEGLWRLAHLYTGAGCHAEARDAARRATRQDPESSRGWALLGVNELHLGEHAPALAHLRRAAAIGLPPDTDGERALRALALLLVKAGDYAATAKPLPILVRRHPEDPELTAACGLMALRIKKLPGEMTEAERDVVLLAGQAAGSAMMGRMDEARRRFDELIARYPRRRGVHLAYGLVLTRDDPPEAVAQLRREVELFPDSAEAHLEIAFEALDRGDPREALEPARAAARLAPDAYSSHLALGRALLAAGGVEESISHLEIAARLAPEARDVYLALAQAYARAGRTTEVERARHKLQELDIRRGAGPR